MLSRFFRFLVCLLLGAVGLTSCKKNSFNTEGKLSFSADTVLFDTVFTTVGSSTRALKIYNTHSEAIRIDNIYIARGQQSKFRMNVNGVAGNRMENVEILPNDSLWVFVEVTLDPNNQNTPLLVTDSILFEVNGHLQDVDLVAFGQDAIFLYPQPGNFGFFLDCDVQWNNVKPYVIYGQAIVKEGCCLTMLPGTRVYLHKFSSIAVAPGGCIDIQGTKIDSVILQGDRLELEYREVPGQWDFLYMKAPASAKINYAVIKNANVGIWCDSLRNPSTYDVEITNTRVWNMSATAMYARNGSVKMENCIFANGGQYVGAFTWGGKYLANHCTFANYYNYGSRNTPSVILTNYFQDENDVITPFNLDEASFTNCIIFGNNPSEFELSNVGGGAFNYKLSNTCIRVKNDFNSSDPLKFENILRNPIDDSMFVNPQLNDYRLRATSPVRDKGSNAFLSPATYNDIEGVSRTLDGMPDMGAYEYKP